MLASVSEKERKRQEAIFELLTTERHYVDSLKLVKEIFLDPMVQEEILTEEELAKVLTYVANERQKAAFKLTGMLHLVQF